MFDALSHPTRIRILRLLREKPRSFAELKHELGLESSGHLQYHMSKLAGLVVDDGRYVLTGPGTAALNLVEESEKPGSSLESVCASSENDDIEKNQIRLELDHVHIKFLDRERTLDFYEALGFKVKRVRSENGEYVFIALSKGQIAPSGLASKEEVSIGVVVDRLDGAYNLAKKHGVEIVDDIKDHSWGTRGFSVRDPSGYVIEFEQARA
ncbi:MAG TPA: VOC family protein [Candidatus Bathyarchaeia archaeon]|jgi:catechol 2,3-dioxygenase-like lactoylglutathione lyase family enzyme|nr:VOC family protein [Candidatus Bathyarchaeia archaeon]